MAHSVSRRQLFTRRREAVVRPPWAVDESAFVTACTRCNDCIEVCEPAVLMRGDGGFPEFSPARGECTFCEACVDACKTGALSLSVSPVMPWIARLGDHCVVMKGVECRICAEQCEPAAIRIRPRPGGIFVPELNAEVCNGCGACVRPCPVQAISFVRQSEEMTHAR